MRRVLFALLVGVVAMFVATSALAWHVNGHVYCDVNQNRQIDPDDTLLDGVKICVESLTTDFEACDLSPYYTINLPDQPDSYHLYHDPSTLPVDGVVKKPVGGDTQFDLDGVVDRWTENWLIDAPECHEQQAGQCWMTGGGVKFDRITGEMHAEMGPHHTFGGNVFPSCSPDPGDGGHWNHIDHTDKWHFKGNPITQVECGNAEGTEPGSDSPVTPFNYIEYRGTGTLKGIKGNHDDFGTVYFFARVEDRNEPGSHGADDGDDVDRYFLHVFADMADPVGSTLLLVDMDGDPSTVDPILISGGNLQLHISSCDDPPNF